MPKLHIYPENPLIDEKFSVKVTELTPGQAITIHSAVNENGARFAAVGCYYADERGVVDVATSPSVGGTYTGTEDMGLIWSMIQEPGLSKTVRLIVKDVEKPLTVTFCVYSGHQTWDNIYSKPPKTITSSLIDRWYKAKNVQRIPVRTGRIRGALFIPEGNGPFPGVIDLFGATGGLMDFRAALLASRGFLSLSLAYINYEDIKIILSTDYHQEAIDYVLSLPMVIKSGLGVIGVSAGGTNAFLQATYCTGIKAVVAVNGAPYPVLSVKHGDMTITSPKKGGFDPFKGKQSPEGVVYREAYYLLDNDDIFKVWDKDVDVLCIIGEDDQSISPEVTKSIFTACPLEKRHKIQMIEYVGAGHLVEPPYAPLCRACYAAPYGITQVWGGKVKEHAFAQEDSWSRILTFLRSKLMQCNQKGRL